MYSIFRESSKLFYTYFREAEQEVNAVLPDFTYQFHIYYFTNKSLMTFVLNASILQKYTPEVKSEPSNSTV